MPTGGGKTLMAAHAVNVLAQAWCATDAPVAVVEYKGAHLLNDPYEIEKRQIGELRALKSQGRCLFGQIAMQRDGVGMSGQLDVLLA